MNIYSIRDNLAEYFNKPFAEHNNATAIRAFSMSSDKNPNIEDFSLYLLGAYNEQTGQIISEKEPQRIFSGLDVKATEKMEQMDR